MITRQYLKDVPKNDDEDDYRNYTLVDGKKVPNHGHWEYLDDEGNVASKGTFIDGYHEGAWQVFHANGSPLRRNFYLRGDIFPEVPLMGDETIMVPKMEYYDIEYNSFNEIEDEDLIKEVQGYINFSGLRLALDTAIKKPDEYIKPFCFYEMLALVLKQEKRTSHCVRHYFNEGGNKILDELIKEQSKFWSKKIYRLDGKHIPDLMSWINDARKGEGLRKLYVG